VILVSPVYVPDSPDSDDWSKTLELWKNIALQLPRVNNLQVCFREVFPQAYGNQKWTQYFNTVMRSAGLNLGIYLFFAGGADNFTSDYPLSGVPSMNALFRGARSMYNASGDFYQEPMEIINAEYTWNIRSTGFFREPLRNSEAVSLWSRYIYQDGEPQELFGADGLYPTACELLYGSTAGLIMAQYYRESAWLPDRELSAPDGEGTYLPMTWNRAYAVPSHWRHLALDSKTWGLEIKDRTYLGEVARLKIDSTELHRRLARRWRIVAGLNSKGAEYITKALAADPLAGSAEDLHFLQTSFRGYQPLTQALAELHEALQEYSSGQKDSPRTREKFGTALRKAEEAQQLAGEAFPHPIDPVGGEVGAIRRYSAQLVQSIQSVMK
jgi:hypothetical protein